MLLFLCDLPWVVKKGYVLKTQKIDEGCNDLYFWTRKKRVVNELAPQGVLKFSQALTAFKSTRLKVIEFLDGVSLDKSSNRIGWELEQLEFQKGTILSMESTAIFYKKLFPNDLISGDLSNLQSNIEKEKQSHTQAVKILPERDQRLVSLRV